MAPSETPASVPAAGFATAVARAPEIIADAAASSAAVVEPHASESSAPADAPADSHAASAAQSSEAPTQAGTEGSADSAGEAVESSETMDQLLEQFSKPEPVASEGEIFDGRVLAVTEAGVVVDVGGKFEGLVPASEFLESGAPIEFGAGQTIEVERLHEHKEGYVLLSHVRAHRRRVWERIEKSYRERATLTGKVTERIKGGLVVDIGVRAFLPASQIELRPVHDLDAWKDRDIERARPETESQARQRGGQPARAFSKKSKNRSAMR